MLTPLHVLIIEDQPDDAELMLHALRQAGFAPDARLIDTRDAYEDSLHDGLDLILADYTLPQFNAIEALLLLQDHRLDIPFIVVTGSVSEAIAVQCMKLGAADYLLKDRLMRLGEAVRSALAERELRREKRNAELELLKSEQQYRLLFEANPRPMLIYDPHTLDILEVNDAAVALYGYDRAAFIRLSFRDLQVNAKAENPVGAGTSHLGTGPLVQHLKGGWHRRQDGSALEVELDTSAMTFFGRLAILAMVDDVTERNHVAQQNERYEQGLEALLPLSRHLTQRHEAAALFELVVTATAETLPRCGGASLWHWADAADAPRPLAHHRVTEPILAALADRLGALEESVPQLLLLRGDAEAAQPVSAVPLRAEGRLIGMLCAHVAPGAEPFDGKETQLLESLAAQVAVAIQNVRLFEHLRAVPLQLLEAEEAERRRIAQELHDEVGGLLTGLLFSLEALGGEDNPDVREASQLVDLLMTQVRHLALDLRPHMLDGQGLVPALEWLFKRYTSQTAIQIDFQNAFPSKTRLDPAIETAAYRIVQEALTNVARYAGVPTARVELSLDPGEAVKIHVRDNGAGFDPAQPRQQTHGLGLSGMRERTALLGGSFEIISAPQQGTSIHARLPVVPPAPLVAFDQRALL